jgi:hypothetical protein
MKTDHKALIPRLTLAALIPSSAVLGEKPAHSGRHEQPGLQPSLRRPFTRCTVSGRDGRRARSSGRCGAFEPAAAASVVAASTANGATP